MNLQQRSRPNSVYVIFPAIILLVVGLYRLSLLNYLLYHSIIEFLAIVVAITIFIIGWNTRKFSRNNMIIILAAGYLAVGSLDMLHTLAFSGMGVFPQHDSNLPTQFWIAARYVEGIAVFLGALYIGRKKVPLAETWLFGFLAAGVLLTYAIFAGVFPDCYVEGEGLTMFKIVSEFVVSAIFIAAGVIFWHKRTYLGRNILRLLLMAGVLTVLSEMSFTLYVDVYGFFNFLGHIFKLFSILLIYRALVEESLTNPYQLLFKEIAASNEKLSQNEKKFRDLVEHTTDWVWEVDLNGKLTYTNPRIKGLTGFELDEIIGRIPFDFMDPTGEGKAKEYFEDALAHANPFYQLESTMLNKDGFPVIFETSGVPVLNEQGELTGYRGIGRDITERKEAEKKLQQAKDEVEQANRAKSIFLANMSHEIRTPMNVIIGMTDILNNSGLNPNQKECAGMVRESANSLLTIINDILDFSKIEAGRLEIAKIHFNLAWEVERTVASFALQAQKKGLKLSCSIDDNVPRIVTGDSARLQQVLINLIGNALKFTEQGEVAVNIRQDDGGILFSISDTGIGIPADKDWLFQSFTQADTSGARKYEGTGLGLAISKNLVELMGGSIGVKSVENRGSTFFFTIPFDLPEDTADTLFSQQPVGSLSEQPSPETKALEILLVEDKPMNQKLATVLLEQKGHKVTTAVSGKEALEALKAQRFDLILMDIHMPEMDGLEVTKRIRTCEVEAVRDIPIIAMTAYAMKEDRDRCLQAGMNYYVSKPINPEELYYALSIVMEGRMQKTVQHSSLPAGLDEMLARIDGNIELLGELMDLFFQDYYQDMAKLKESMTNKDIQTLTVVIHGLKGELGNLGMNTAYKLACELEKMIKSDALEEASAVLQQLENEIKVLERYFSDPDWHVNLVTGEDV